jgi:hypothetical protein
VQGSTAHSSNTQAFEEWSKAKTALFALRAEKARDGLFSIFPTQQPREQP